MEYTHEFRDPIHTSIHISSDELKVIDLQPFQILRDVHQLALTYLVFPGATHTRFEHSLGVMELASCIFDAVTDTKNILDSTVQKLIPTGETIKYWKSVLRATALCHDIGHLPFSHASEDLLPCGYDHERLTRDILLSDPMRVIFDSMKRPLLANDVSKLALTRTASDEPIRSPWENVMAEIINGSFGADRMDYLLRDSYYVGIKGADFDHCQIIKALRLLPTKDKGTDTFTIGLDASGLNAFERLMIARNYMFMNIYFHPIRRIYDIHLKDFLTSWLSAGQFPIDLENHLRMSDIEVMYSIREADFDPKSPHHDLARRIQRREHFISFFEAQLTDERSDDHFDCAALADIAEREFGKDRIRYDFIPAILPSPEFPVLRDGKIESSLILSQTLAQMSKVSVERIYCEKSLYPGATELRNMFAAKSTQNNRAN